MTEDKDQKPIPPPNADDPDESERFIDMAREIGADESPDAMEKAFRRVIMVAKRPPSPDPSEPL